MRRPVSRALGAALSLIALAACTSNPEDTIVAPSSGEIIVDDDLIDTSPLTTTVATVEPPGPATSSTTTPTASTAKPTTTPKPTTTTPRRTTTRPSNNTATTEPELVGDGPVLTAPRGVGTAETSGVGGGLVPAFFALEATPIVACSTANPSKAQLRWEVIGSEAVDIAIGRATQIFRLAQPPAGTLEVPLDCASGSTYFVVASNPDGSTTRSVTLGADAA